MDFGHYRISVILVRPCCLTGFSLETKPKQQKKSTLAAAVEICTRRESDFSSDDLSEVESNVSDVDSVAEDMFLEGEDPILDRYVYSMLYK